MSHAALKTRRLAVEPLEQRDLLSCTALSSARSDLAAAAAEAQTDAERSVRLSLEALGLTAETLTDEFVFSLASCPESTYTIYLDFTGHLTSSTRWNTTYTRGKDIVTPVYDTDENPEAFSSDELLEIYEIWLRVSEDYAPFAVNVTTQEPSLDRLVKSGSTDTEYGVRCCVGGSSYDWYGEGGGGLSFVRSFTDSVDTPCFVFIENLSYLPKNIAEAAAHEVGHTLGLHHDGIRADGETTEYYQGTEGWAPIMGGSYYQPLTQWSRGEYTGATTHEDDLAIITGNGFSYREDDYGNTAGDAYALTLDSTGLLTGGIIEQNSDIDYFSFDYTGQSGILVIGGLTGITNLNAKVSLYDAGENLLEVYDPAGWLNVTIDLENLASGSYFLAVEGTGQVTDAQEIYSSYGSIGTYTIVLAETYRHGDVGSSLANAADLVFDAAGRAAEEDILGNELVVFRGKNYYYDVDLYRLSLSDRDIGNTFRVSAASASALPIIVRIFNADGEELTVTERAKTQTFEFSPTQAGSYYIGISLPNNAAYDPTSCKASGNYLNCTPTTVTLWVQKEKERIGEVTLSSQTPMVGSKITAKLDTSAQVTWQWYRDGEAIRGATGSSYKVTGADLGCTLSVAATGKGKYYGSSGAEAAAITRQKISTPVLTSPSPAAGDAISVRVGPDGVTAEYQWYRAGIPIEGAQGASYIVAAGDAGSRLICVVTGTGCWTGTYTLSASVRPTIPVGTLRSVTLSIDAPTVGSRVSAAVTISGSAAGRTVPAQAVTWQWYRDGEAIRGAVTDTYRVTGADIGHTLSVTAAGRGILTGTVTQETTVPAAAQETLLDWDNILLDEAIDEISDALIRRG